MALALANRRAVRIKKTFKIAGWIILIPVIIFVAFLIYITASDYKPPAEVKLQAGNNTSTMLKQGEPFTVTTYNIGYAGLDQGQDFFMDGGTMSRSSSKKQTEDNLAAIIDFMKEADSDIYIMQEIDQSATRSFRINEVDQISNALPSHSSTFATNYKVPWVPVPVMDPMGGVESGLLTLSAFQSSSQTRFDLPGKEKWPVQLFELDRAMVESRFPIEGGKELVLVNLHLSAFDKGGTIRKQQLDFLSDYIDRELKKGSYLIIGGDWNHSLPDTDPSTFATTQQWPEWLQPFPEQFGPADFQWAIDPTTPTVRTLDIAYQEGVNFLAVIDGFLVSPNVEVVSVKGTDLGFKNADHNPVTSQFILK